jgi:hypothetical protein
MEANATVNVPSDTPFDIIYDAVSEAQFEHLTIEVDSVVMVDLTAENVAGGCQVSTCNMCENLDKRANLTLQEGNHLLELIADTRDGLYHQGAYFFVRFATPNCSSTCRKCGSSATTTTPTPPAMHTFSEVFPGCEPACLIEVNDAIDDACNGTNTSVSIGYILAPGKTSLNVCMAGGVGVVVVAEDPHFLHVDEQLGVANLTKK